MNRSFFPYMPTWVSFIKNIPFLIIKFTRIFLSDVFYFFRGMPSIPDFPQTPKHASTLVVLLHGVNQKQYIWKRKVQWMLTFLPSTCAVYAPWFNHTTKPMAENVRPLLVEIKAFQSKHPAAKIVVVGFSNGGRYAMHLEAALNPKSVKRVVTVASPLNGTHALRYAPAWLGRYAIGADLYKEMLAGFVETKRAPDWGKYETFSAEFDEKVFPETVTTHEGVLKHTKLAGIHETAMRSETVMRRIAEIINE